MVTKHIKLTFTNCYGSFLLWLSYLLLVHCHILLFWQIASYLFFLCVCPLNSFLDSILTIFFFVFVIALWCDMFIIWQLLFVVVSFFYTFFIVFLNWVNFLLLKFHFITLNYMLYNIFFIENFLWLFSKFKFKPNMFGNIT